MKISKLFHWLYAVLMFLPLLVFLPTGFYYAFNDNAQAQEYTREEPIYYQSNEVNSVADIYEGYIYHFNSENIEYGTTTYTFYFDSFYNFQSTQNELHTYESSNLVIPRYSFDFNQYFCYQLDQNQDYAILHEYDSSAILSFDFVASSNNNYTYFVNCISECTYQVVKEYQEVTYTMGIIDSMSNAWVHTWEMPLFGWSANTFINEPFSYITSLFNIPNDSTFSSAFGYWVSISICWLVFDVIMYVPLLAHRWIDKARIE